MALLEEGWPTPPPRQRLPSLVPEQARQPGGAGGGGSRWHLVILHPDGAT